MAATGILDGTDGRTNKKNIRKNKRGWWRKVLESDPCVYCFLIDQKQATLEHVIPLSSDGPNTWDNIVGACPGCNHRRGSLPLLKWLIVLSYWKQGRVLTKRQRKDMGLWFDDPEPQEETISAS